MSDIALAQRLGQRMNHLLVDQSLFAWTHRILGLLAGCVCVLCAIATKNLVLHMGYSMWFGRSFSGRASIIFFAAAVPLVISYLSNRDLVDDSIRRTVVFAFCLVGTSIIVDIGTVMIFRSSYSPLILSFVYSGQAVAYVGLGHITLPRRDEWGAFGW